VNTREWHKISLELIQVNVKVTIETQAGGKRATDPGVEVIITRAGDVKLALTDIVNSLIVHKESALRVLNGTRREEKSAASRCTANYIRIIS
jgi:hypothetical protein